MIFFPNFSHNHYIVNECFVVNIPSFSLIDTIENPSNVFFPIPSNSRSVKSLFFYYILFTKIALHVRYNSASTFLFSFFKKSKNIFLKGLADRQNIVLKSDIFLNYLTLFSSKILFLHLLFNISPKSIQKLKSFFHANGLFIENFIKSLVKTRCFYKNNKITRSWLLFSLVTTVILKSLKPFFSYISSSKIIFKEGFWKRIGFLLAIVKPKVYPRPTKSA